MNAAQVLEHSRALGIVLSAGGGKLRYEAPTGRIPPELRQALAENKAAILDILVTERWWHWLVTFPDRRSIDVAYGRRITRAEVLAEYPEAAGAETVPDAPRRPPRCRNLAEVVRGIVAVHGLSCEVERVIAEIEAWPPNDHAEMLADAGLAEAAVRAVEERWRRTE